MGRTDEHAGSRLASEAVNRSVSVMTPDLANPAGHIHGGHVVYMANNLAWICATRFSRVPCATVAVERVDLLAPVLIGDYLDLEARVVLVGPHSIDVDVDVRAEDPLTGEERLTETCSFTFAVLKGEDGSRPKIPSLVLDTRESKIAALLAWNRRQSGRLLGGAHPDQELESLPDSELDVRLGEIGMATS